MRPLGDPRMTRGVLPGGPRVPVVPDWASRRQAATSPLTRAPDKYMASKKLNTSLHLAAVGVNTATGTPAGSLARMAVAPMMNRFLARIGNEKAARAYNLLIESLAVAGDLPPDDAQERVRTILEGAEPEVEDHLYENFQSMARARTEAAWPYIAKLTAEFIHNRRPVDTYFRRVGWLMENATEEELVTFFRLIRESVKFRDRWKAEGFGIQAVLWRSGFEGGATMAMVTGITVTIPAKPAKHLTVSSGPEDPKGFWFGDCMELVRSSRLAEIPSNKLGEVRYWEARGTLDRLYKLVGPEPEPEGEE